MDEKYKKEDVDKFMFLIRYYYLMCDGVEKKISKEGKKDGETEDFVEAVVNFSFIYRKGCVLGLLLLPSRVIKGLTLLWKLSCLN